MPLLYQMERGRGEEYDQILFPQNTQWDIAQLVEQVTVNHRVTGSSPVIPANMTG